MMNKLVPLLGMLLGALAVGAHGADTPPFRVGEKLTYQIFWGPFVGGRATLEVRGIDTVDGHDCYHLVASAWTTGLADLLFHVVSTTDSWLDVQDLCSRRYRENRIEGKRTYNTDTVYDYAQHCAIITEYPGPKRKTIKLDAPVVDVIASLYYTRTRPLALAVKQSMLVNNDGKNYHVTFTPDHRKTMWLRPTGDIAALRIEPSPTLNVVAANHGRMWFWVSDDQRKLPLLVTTDMKIGSAKLVLNKIETNANADTRPSLLPAPLTATTP